MNKRGFTLVELLAVIAILAILVIIALPNVMGMFNQAKENSFTTEIKEIYKTAQQEWISESMFNTSEKAFANTESDSCPNKLDLTGRKQLEYYIKFNKAGNVTKYYATDGTYQYKYDGDGLKIEDIKDVEQITDINESEVISITCDMAGGNTNTPVAATETLYYNVIEGGEVINIGSPIPSSLGDGYETAAELVSSLMVGSHPDHFCNNAGNCSYIVAGITEGNVTSMFVGFTIGGHHFKLKAGDSYSDNVGVLDEAFESSECVEDSVKMKCLSGDIIVSVLKSGTIVSQSPSGRGCFYIDDIECGNIDSYPGLPHY